MNNESLVLLTVRGSLVPTSLEAARSLHNETAGSPDGIAAARALGDLSHNVYAPVKGAPGSVDGELLFLDRWQTAEGVGTFFGNPHVGAQAQKMFSKRAADLWMPARGAFGFSLSAPTGRHDRWLGIIRGPVKSAEAAIGVFRDGLGPQIASARRRGQIEHQLFVKLPMPGDTVGAEILGVDVWYDAAGMQEHYAALPNLGAAFSGAPSPSVWQAAAGNWSEW